MPKKEESKDENVPNQSKDSKDQNKNGESKIIWDTEEKWLIEKVIYFFN